MDWFELPTEREIYLGKVIYYHIKKLDFDDENHAIILEWREATSEGVKKRTKTYKNLIVKAK